MRDGRFEGRVTRESGEHHPTRSRLSDMVEADLFSIRAILAESGDGRHDDTRIEVLETIVGEFIGHWGARRKVVQHDIGFLDQFSEDFWEKTYN